MVQRKEIEKMLCLMKIRLKLQVKRHKLLERKEKVVDALLAFLGQWMTKFPRVKEFASKNERKNRQARL